MAHHRGLADRAFPTSRTCHVMPNGNRLLTLALVSTADAHSFEALPEGYALFIHHKLQPNGTDRTDTYLFVSCPRS